jgi:prepilin-type N-terminal cleavage/methylation domain-containing protein
VRIRTNKPIRGFSLVELLLTLVLILCLAAASVFTFTALYRSANLDEGYDRFQSLIRFAQAEAATTGRKVRLQFVPVEATESTNTDEERPELRRIEVTWEADLLNAPGVFQSYTNKSWSEEMVNELVGVEKVQSIQSPNIQGDAGSSPTFTESEAGSFSEAYATRDFPSVTFYPDGSCDSAEIVLASRNPEDERRVEVRLTGILGSVSSRTISGEEALSDELDDAEREYDELFESSQPANFFAESSNDFPLE